jgi:hypothetical protein
LNGNDVGSTWSPLTFVVPTNQIAGWETNYNIVGPRTDESLTIARFLTLQFTPSDPEGLALSGTWGDSQIGGYYQEIITGLRKNPIYIAGTFRLHRAVGTGFLNQ